MIARSPAAARTERHEAEATDRDRLHHDRGHDLAALRSSEPRAHYNRRRDGGERHTPALRNLFSKLLGCLYHCLRNRTLYDAAKAFPERLTLAA
ncbi:hypothetical protein ACIRP7_27040 [Streptomyces sp. NPDC102270]|uniref:hypothetical protein n=1 Tax=Streptomyces sp. NPDC102270 TaxID=3366150 RepID=UPI0038082EB7